MENVLQECAELVDELNAGISDNKYLSGQCIGFRLVYDGYTTAIMLGDITLYDSENGTESEYSYELEYYIEVPVKQFVLKKVNKILYEFRKISFWITKELKSLR